MRASCSASTSFIFSINSVIHDRLCKPFKGRSSPSMLLRLESDTDGGLKVWPPSRSISGVIPQPYTKLAQTMSVGQDNNGLDKFR